MCVINMKVRAYVGNRGPAWYEGSEENQVIRMNLKWVLYVKKYACFNVGTYF